MAKKIIDRNVFGFPVMAAVSKDWTGFDGGLFQLKVISKPESPNLKAVRLVLYRLFFWFALQRAVNNGNH